jgi:hypothetical protein
MIIRDQMMRVHEEQPEEEDYRDPGTVVLNSE